MPTATEFFGYTVTNLGPFTTSFSVPTTCASFTDYYAIGPSQNYSTAIYGVIDCNFPKHPECYPSGSKFDDLVERQRKSIGQGYFPYFSPGNLCPSEWDTVGVFAAATDATKASSSGIFTEDLWPFDDEPGIEAAGFPAAAIFTGIVDPGETVVWCCPSGHTANIYGGCISSVGPLSSYSYTEYCLVVIPTEDIVTVTSFDGTVYSPPLYSITPAVTELSTMRNKISDAHFPTSEAIVIRTFPIFAMIQKPSDVSEASSTGTESPKGSSGSDQGGDKKDAAASFPIFTLFPVIAIGVSLVFGAGLIAAW